MCIIQPQVTIWSAPAATEHYHRGHGADPEVCLGSAQVSLADFDVETVSVRWYNVLSFHFMQQPRERERDSTHKQVRKIICKMEITQPRT